MTSRTAPRSHPQRPYVVAMLLGTALSAFGTASGASAQTPETTLRAIADMGRYCTTCWRNARLPIDSWNDCTQEVFYRLLERVPARDWDQVLRDEGDGRREFLRAIDAVKKRTQRARKLSNTVEAVADDRACDAGKLRDEREAVDRAAEELLSPRQQRILQMGFEGWSVQDMARELGL